MQLGRRPSLYPLNYDCLRTISTHLYYYVSCTISLKFLSFLAYLLSSPFSTRGTAAGPDHRRPGRQARLQVFQIDIEPSSTIHHDDSPSTILNVPPAA